ncbi:TrbC/VirB2 family protein [Sphingobium sp. DEHP117]|uniref:TrbC/VirB2 family protein n=1 Tax=Sphingobium sp. DEHP117 TaxID=2993436 RepID=UPI0027D6ED12|nr:TrbC/VirB2 family protein [Sphingobium sp. DEHP117]MDQ4422178.1 TrbC/VirB2 family protein [Sphingobium sp. DEHP117]
MQHDRLMRWVAGISLALLPSSAFATTTAGALPWEGPLSLVQQSLNGPVAGALSLISITVAGATLIFGGEIGDFAKRLCYIVLVIGIMALAGTAYTTLFAGAAATIGKTAPPSDPTGTYLLAAILGAYCLRRTRSWVFRRKVRVASPAIIGA